MDWDTEDESRGRKGVVRGGWRGRRMGGGRCTERIDKMSECILGYIKVKADLQLP